MRVDGPLTPTPFKVSPNAAAFRDSRQRYLEVQRRPTLALGHEHQARPHRQGGRDPARRFHRGHIAWRTGTTVDAPQPIEEFGPLAEPRDQRLVCGPGHRPPLAKSVVVPPPGSLPRWPRSRGEQLRKLARVGQFRLAKTGQFHLAIDTHVLHGCRAWGHDRRHRMAVPCACSWRSTGRRAIGASRERGEGRGRRTRGTQSPGTRLRNGRAGRLGRGREDSGESRGGGPR